jgi:transposase
VFPNPKVEVEWMVADELDFVIGVDPHRDVHALAVVHARSGALVLETRVAASVQGYREALRLAEWHAPGRRGWAIEGTGSYGAGLARLLAEQGERVLEVGHLRRERRSQAKTDALDALRAARSVLSAERPACPRSHGKREALRALIVAREGALDAKKAALCQLRALIVTCPEPLRGELAPLTRARLLSRCSRLRPSRSRDELRGTLIALQSIARRARALTEEERNLKREIETLVQTLAPTLTTEPGIGPISAAQILIAWSHPGRVHSEAAFARLAGAAPIPASSGQIVRHRLDRGGDRKLNRALHTIIVSRRKSHPATIAYIERRLSEGKTVREAIRSLKRYLARHLYRLLEGAPLPA